MAESEKRAGIIESRVRKVRRRIIIVYSRSVVYWMFLPVRILWNAVSTLVESRAEVSMKLRLFFSANTLASSVGTARR